MPRSPIQVRVFQYPDRKHLVLRYEDPVTGKPQTRTAKTANRREADREAAKWEAELQKGSYQEPHNITWEEFRERYESEKLLSLSKNTLESANTALNHIERIINPYRLAALTAVELSRFQAELRKAGLEETSIASHLRHLSAAFSWAVRMGLLSQTPKIEMPKRARGRTMMRGRPITTEEFERMLSKTSEIRLDDAASWKYYLTGLWLSGLRLEESTLLSWDDDGLIRVDLSGRRPRLRIYAEAEKGHQDRLLPMTPDFAEFLQKTPVSARQGPVFRLCGRNTRRPLIARSIGREISAIGRLANIVVNKSAGKYASAHDLRRSFGTRWAKLVRPATLQLLMRHRSIETTMKYYVDLDADDVADELWACYQQSKPLAQHSDESDARFR